MIQALIDRLIDEQKIKCRPTLASISSVLHIAPYKLASIAKFDDSGRSLPRNQFNWEAIQAFIERRLDPDSALRTVEDVVCAAAELSLVRYTKRGKREKKIKPTITLPDGRIVPDRYIALEVGTEVGFRGAPPDEIYEVRLLGLFQTVLENKQTKELKVISNSQVNTRIRRSSLLRDWSERSIEEGRK